MTLGRALGIIVGVIAFAVSHVLITGAWLRETLTPNPLIRPWFTNSTGAVVLTSAVVAFGAVLCAFSAPDRRQAMRRGLAVGVGAIVAMLAVMTRTGIGSLGPIVVIMGGAILLAAGAAGGSIAAMLKNS